MSFDFNPKLSEIKEEDPTIFGTIWMYVWRFFVLYFGVIIVAAVIVELLE